MKKLPQIGLVVEGNITHSAILRMPKLVEDLGPIKSATIRVARRVSNFLKAGHAVADYEELQSAQLILLRVPDEVVPRIVEEIFAADLILKDISFVLCESWLTLESLRRSSSGAPLSALYCLFPAAAAIGLWSTAIPPPFVTSSAFSS